MSTEQNKAIVQQLFEAANQGVEAWAAAHAEFSPDLVAHFSGQPPLNYEAHEQFGRMLFAAFPDIWYTVEELLAEGDKVVVRWTARGTHKGEFQGIPATSKSAAVQGISINRFAGSKIVEQWSQFDQLGMLQQLGIIPVPGTTG